MKAVDSSAFVEFLLNTERFARVAEYFDDELIASDLVIPEALSALRKIGIRHPRTARRIQQSVDVLADLPVEWVPLQALTQQIWDLRSSITPYDASHVAVARLAGCPLITADARLARAVPHGTAVILV